MAPHSVHMTLQMLGLGKSLGTKSGSYDLSGSGFIVLPLTRNMYF